MCESSFLHSFSGSHGEDAALIPWNVSVSAAAVKGTHPSKLSRSCFAKRQFQFGVWLALHCDGCFVAVMGGVFSLKASPGSLLHIEVPNMKEPSCILSYPKRSRVTIPCCLMLIVATTAKQSLVSVLC